MASPSSQKDLCEQAATEDLISPGPPTKSLENEPPGDPTEADPSIGQLTESHSDSQAREVPPRKIKKTRRVVFVAWRARTWQIRRFWILIALHLVYIIILATLLGISQHKSGIRTLRPWQYKADEKPGFGDRSLAWTTVPTLFFTLFTLFMKWCYGDVIELEPVLPLFRGDSRSGDGSISVNYRQEPLFHIATGISSYTAWKRGHRITAFWFWLSTVFQVIITPLSAHMFQAQLWKQTRDVDVMQVTHFNGAAFDQDDIDLTQAFDIALAMEVYGSQEHIFSQWVDRAGNYSFPTYSSLGSSFRYNSTVQLTDVAGYGFQLENCRFQNENTVGDVLVQADQDDWKLSVGLGNTGCSEQQYYAFWVPKDKVGLHMTTAPFNCTVEGQKEPAVKVAFVWVWTNQASNETLDGVNKTIATCESVLSRQVGNLHVAIENRATIANFTIDQDRNRPADPESVLTLKQHMRLLEAISGHDTETTTTTRGLRPAKSPSSSTTRDVDGRAFARLVMNRFDMTRRSAATPWAANDAGSLAEFQADVVESMRSVFRTLALASLATAGAFEVLEWPPFGEGELRSAVEATDVERLFVVPWVAGLALAFLAASFLLAWAGLLASYAMREADVALPHSPLGYLGLWTGGGERFGRLAAVVKHGRQHQPGLRGRSFEEIALEDPSLGKANYIVEKVGADRTIALG